jgi:outer membrane protein insertion porin family
MQRVRGRSAGGVRPAASGGRDAGRERTYAGLLACRLALLVGLLASLPAIALTVSASELPLSAYEGRNIAAIEIVFEGSVPDPAAQRELLSLLKVAANTEYSAVHVRDSLQSLFDSGRVAAARVEVVETAPGGPVRVRFVIQRTVLVAGVRLVLGPVTGTPISEDELRARLDLLHSAARPARQTIGRNADEILIYLRDRGYLDGMVEPHEELDPTGTRATVTYNITPGPPARMDRFDITIAGYDAALVSGGLKLKSGALFTREALADDLSRIRQALIAAGYLSPVLDDPRVEREGESDLVAVTLTGRVGPKVEVVVKNFEMTAKTQRELLPIEREGNIDASAIVEGARRLRNKLQEAGYFFAEVTAVCTVTPPTDDIGQNGTARTCDNLNPDELTGHEVNVTYEIERGRRFRLADIRIEGTNLLSYEDVAAELGSQKTSPLRLIPFLSYGRGYTSLALLEQDKRLIEEQMREFGYRHATVDVLQGVSLDGEDLIITFKVTPGPLTRVAEVEVKGSKVFSPDRLRTELHTVIGAPYSRTAARFDGERLINFYSKEGYISAQLDFSVVELPRTGDEEQVRIVYTITGEGEKTYINRLVVSGVTGDAKTQRVKRDAIARAIPLFEGDVLRSDRVAEAERNLYITDAYSQVTIRTEPAGERANGDKLRDVIVEVEEKKPRVIDYGGGYSTDTGPLGLLEISNVNLMNKLRQGAMRLRVSQRQQLLRFEFTDLRFARYGKTQFAPLALSVQYQRDSTITRFFRSAIDRGTFGIVQRLDENGNPVDQFGASTSEPTINRFTVTAETQRELEAKSRTIVFARYSYEDVRLFNLESLLIRPVLDPDRAIRLSRVGASLVRDTRERCERTLSSYPTDNTDPRTGEVCRFNQLDPTRGSFFTFDYALALRQLGGNVSFNKVQASYRSYLKVDRLRGTILAGNVTFGLGNMISPRDRNANGVIDEVDQTLPISERFFSGGSTTLRGFSFEEAGPRQAVIPEGIFHNNKGEAIGLSPFTVPLGGNAVAVVNLEARVPLNKEFQVVPFYDGGNVFHRVGDLFGKPTTVTVPPGDLLKAIDAANLHTHWTHTVGLGFRVQTPFGGALAIDYGFLLTPPRFLVPQKGPGGQFDAPPAVFQLNRTQLHLRFTQTF